MVTGLVEKFATISPRRVRLAGTPGIPLKTEVQITPEDKYPFKILSVTAKNGANIRHTLQEKSITKGKSGYLLTVENSKKDVGRYFDTLVLKTDSKIQPEITISVYGNIFAKKQ